MTPSFFDYFCTQCDAPFCERVHLMNLALDYLEDEYCLDCLSGLQGCTVPDLADSVTAYIHTRDCFLNPWKMFDASACPRRDLKTCLCQG